MNPFLQLFYRFLKIFLRVTLGIYYKKIIYINAERLRTAAPLVVVSNHPNTAIDPFLALMNTRVQCYMLANYSLFKNSIAGAILRTLWCIPVKRPQDVIDGAPRDNADAFRQAEMHLLRRRNLYVAPEGTCFTERHVRDCKTGTARIVLAAEAATDFTLGLRVLPIGITYDNALRFGSNVVVEVGEPFFAKDWREMYAENPRIAVENFTQKIENQLIAHSIHCRDLAEDEFLQKIEAVMQSENPLDLAANYRRSKMILTKINAWAATDADDFSAFKADVEAYFSRLKTLNLTEINVSKFKLPLSILTVLLGFPAFLLGFLGNILPTFCVQSIVRGLKADATYDTTIRYCAALVFFPLLWWLETELFCWIFLPKNFDLNFWETVALVAAFIGFGLWAWRVYTEGSKILNYFNVKKADRDGELSKMKKNIVEKLATIGF